MTLDQEFQKANNEERLRKQVGEAKRALDQMEKRYSDLQAKYDLTVALDSAVCTDPPVWTKEVAHRDGKWHGTACLLLSDLHLDEVISAPQMNGVNAYNRRIALRRLQVTAEKFPMMARDFVSGITYDGCVVFLNGDIFSGNIHEELRATNEVPIMNSIDYWVDPIVALLRLAADEFGKVLVVGRVGNHGRNTFKPIFKNRVEDNFDWLFYRIIARELASDSRFSWDLPTSPGGVVKVYSTKFFAHHGDDIKGGTGISGIFTPMSLADFRKSKVQMAIDDPYDYLVLGHWHQYMTLPRIILNGSLKGYDEFARGHNFGFEVPQQAFWITTPEHGVTFSAPIQPMNKSKERW